MLSLLVSASALACGGLFCNPINYTDDPVSQSAEEILFAVDAQAGEVTTHVKIFYEGPADQFSWVVPVPAMPELEVGTNALFAALHQTDAAFELVKIEDQCGSGDGYGSGTGAGTGTGTGTGGWGSSGTTYVPGVDVVAEEAVGPYDTVILQADNSTALTQWLSNNGYAIPAGFDPAVAPYVAGNQFFVAMRLAKDKDVGDMEPLVMRYPGDTAGIPLTLTSVAAVPDMRLRVYVLGEHRAVPGNYLHVQLNHFAIDWWNAGDNYELLTGAAADEAGGHAFATDYVGSGANLADQVFQPTWDSLDLGATPDAYEFLVAIALAGVPVDDPMLAVLQTWIPVPASLPGVTSEQLYGCPSCYETELRDAAFDAAGAAADVETWVFAARRTAAGLLQAHPTLTRLTSTASPHEMTLDPVFVFNPDMAQNIPSDRVATITSLCGGGTAEDSERELQLPNGSVAWLPSPTELAAMGMTEFEFLAPLQVPAALVIEATSESGEPEVLLDNSGEFGDTLNEFNGTRGGLDEREARDPARGCGCSNTGSGAGLWLLLAMPLLFRRR